MSLLSQASLVVTPNGYKEGKLYSVIPSDGSGDMSVTRATTATRVNSAGLVELVPYNLSLWSEDFSNNAWVKDSATIATNIIANPVNGLTTADRWTATTDPSFVFATTSHALSTSRYTFSIYAKKNASSSLRMDLVTVGFTEGAVVNFNLANGTAGTVSQYGSANGFVATITSVGDDWYRLSLSGNVVAATYNTQMYIGSGSIYIFGAQLNEGTIKTYQKTETRLNIPRLDYSNGTCPSLLVEPQRTNIATYSSSFDNAAWTKGEVTISANSVISPDGTQNADAVIESTTANAYHRVLPQYPFTGTGNAYYSFSVYVKKKGATRHIYWMCQNAVDAIYAHFDMTNFTVNQVASSGTGSNASASITPVGDGWYRLTLSGIVSTITTDYYNQFYLENSVSTGFNPNTYTGDGVSGFYLWGWQIEAGSYATSYIPTTSASVTRNADVISKTGISSLIGQTEGTIYMEISVNNANTGNGVFLECIGSSTADTFVFFIDGATNNLRLYVSTSGAPPLFVVNGYIPSTNVKIALAYKNNDFALYVDGVSQSVSGVSVVPSGMANIYLNQNRTGGETCQGNIKAVALWKTRLTNDELERLTGTGFNTYTEMANYYNYITQ